MKKKTVRVSRTRAAVEILPEEESAPAKKTTKKTRKTVSAAVETEAVVAPAKKRITQVKVEKPKKIEMPPILLEGDYPAPPRRAKICAGRVARSAKI